jgi:transcriptional regulator with XRE-family HTH domain
MNMLPINIKKRMQEMRLTPYAVEKQTGIKKSTIHNILLGRVKSPTIGTLLSIAGALKCRVSDLVDEDNIHSLIAHDGPGQALNWELYIDTLLKVGCHLEKHKVAINENNIMDKRKVYELVEEVYRYSLRTSKQLADQAFTEWAADKFIFKKS